ncbi:MAG: hypothetical protein ACM3O3_13035 [Syntrophothermus sp.]
MCKVIFSIDKTSIKALFPELLENALTKNNKIKKGSLKNVSEHIIKDLISYVPDTIKSEFKESNIIIDYEYNQASNDIFFTIDWNKQEFKKYGKYEVITDFQNWFIKDFTEFLKKHDNDNWCKVKTSVLYTGYVVRIY